MNLIMARMNVLLIQDVPTLGLAGEIHTVAGGYARNYLMPRGEAIPASKGAIKQAEEIRQSAQRKRAKERKNAEAQAELISQQRVLFQVRAGDNGRLYGSITSSDIAEKLEEQLGFEVDRRRIQLDAALRDLGIHQVEIRLMPEVNATFAVALVREEESWEDGEKRQATADAAAQAVAEMKAAERMAVAAMEAAEAEAQTEAE
jgi:large subunit ribosomal protein L9